MLLPGRPSRRPGGERRRPRGTLLGIAALAVLAPQGTRAPSAGVAHVVNEPVRTMAAELAALRARMDTEIAACLEQRGLPSFAKTADHHFAVLRAVYTVSFGHSVDEARLFGYREKSVAPATADEISYFESLAPAQQDEYARAHRGDDDDMREFVSHEGARSSYPVGGCTAVAAERVYGTAAAYVEAEGVFDDVQFVVVEAQLRAEQDAVFRDALGRWSACLAAAGHPFAGPADARAAAVATRRGADVPSSRERAIATADARCRSATGLGRAYRDGVVREQRAVAVRIERGLVAWHDLMHEVAGDGRHSPVEAESRRLLARD